MMRLDTFGLGRKVDEDQEHSGFDPKGISCLAPKFQSYLLFVRVGCTKFIT